MSAKSQIHFGTLPDPHRRKVTYSLINFIVIAICAVIYDADDYVAIADFCRMKRRWFRKILDLCDGIETFFAVYPDGRMLTVPIRQSHSTVKGPSVPMIGETPAFPLLE